MAGTALLCACSFANAADQSYGAFLLPADAPDVIQLHGDIDPASALDFRRALQARPTAKVVELASNGGDVFAGLGVAYAVHDNGLSTRIPSGSWCYSACAYVFFAGDGRQAIGELGVHQVALATPGAAVDFVDAQLTIADIIQAMAAFGVDQDVLTAMFRTPPDQIYRFDAEQIASLAINRAALAVEAAPPAQPASQPPVAANVTVVARNDQNAQLTRMDLTMPVSEAADIRETMVRIGFSDAGADLATPPLQQQLGVSEISKGSELRILFGLLGQYSKVFIPYRVSVYSGPQLEHQATIALTDAGVYVIAAEPAGRSDGVDQEAASGKHDRQR